MRNRAHCILTYRFDVSQCTRGATRSNRHPVCVIVDSRDRAPSQRLEFLDDVYKLYRCRTIMNCAEVCPKGLNPAQAIERIKIELLRRSA